MRIEWHKYVANLIENIKVFWKVKLLTDKFKSTLLSTQSLLESNYN